MPIGGHSPPPAAPGLRVCPLHPRTGLQPSLRLCVRLRAVCPRCSAHTSLAGQEPCASRLLQVGADSLWFGAFRHTLRAVPLRAS